MSLHYHTTSAMSAVQIHASFAQNAMHDVLDVPIKLSCFIKTVFSLGKLPNSLDVSRIMIFLAIK